MARQTTLYCHHLVDSPKGPWYAHFFPHPKVTAMCGNEPVKEVLVKELSESSKDCYWAWWDSKDEKFTHVYPVRQLVEMCFPYGVKAAEDRGQGVCLPVEIIEEPT